MNQSGEHYNVFSGTAPSTLSIEHTSRVLGVSRRTLYYWIERGRLSTVRTSMGSQRVRMDSIRAAYLKRRVRTADN